MMGSAFRIRCSLCSAEFTAKRVVPSLFTDAALAAGWAPGDPVHPDVVSSGALWRCPAHNEEQAGPPHVAECATCGEGTTGDREECEWWADEHQCEPDVTVREKQTREQRALALRTQRQM